MSHVMALFDRIVEDIGDAGQQDGMRPTLDAPARAAAQPLSPAARTRDGAGIAGQGRVARACGP